MTETIRPFAADDFAAITQIINTQGTLDEHTPYTYWACHQLYPDLFLVLEDAGQIIGFTMAIGPNASGEVLFWQIGIHPDCRGRGLGQKLALAQIAAAKQLGGRSILVTIDDSNLASRALFTSCAEAYGETLNVLGQTGNMSGKLKSECAYRFSI